ncbi:MAG: vitamin B12 dependent-methionine synthase activation domain-containing protein [Chloroflexota bacterium]|nr:vitamin B12 dependent-methionine synthase activation domain-containing protein [Chloroflexota bacterium]
MVEAIENFDVELDKGEVCRYLGYNGGRGPKPSISHLIDEELEEAQDLLHPSAHYQILDIKGVRKGHVLLDGGITLASDVLGVVMYRCKQAAVFVVNIGDDLEGRVALLMKAGKVLQGTILDAIGSDAAEKTACYLQERVHEVANSSGNEITLRYSPGYCDWDVTEQRAIFKAMDSAPIGVSLTDDCLMVPRKSVSGIIGMGPFERRPGKYSPCRSCTKTDCNIRR